jgi:hypothetical protein
VSGPTLPVPIGRPSISVTPAISPIVPVQNTSSAVYISVSEMSRTSAAMPLAAARSSTVCRVMPSGQATVNGVCSDSPTTANRWVALVSATKPRPSSISASSAPATLASILARIEFNRLL